MIQSNELESEFALNNLHLMQEDDLQYMSTTLRLRPTAQ